jgi:hypothetical protein
VLEGERVAGEAAAVASMVKRDDAELLVEQFEERVPVERARGPETVQQDHGRRGRCGSRQVAGERGAPVRELDRPPYGRVDVDVSDVAYGDARHAVLQVPRGPPAGR